MPDRSDSQRDEIDVNSLFSLAGKTALVTGGSSGLGLMMVQGLLQSGVKVIIASRSKEKCARALEKLSGMGQVKAITADITDSEQRLALVKELGEAVGSTGLCILVNNAGSVWGANIEDYPDSAFEKVMTTNVNAVFSLTRDLLPLLQRAGTAEDPARVINIGSMDGIHVPVVQRQATFAYSASKAAVHHLTRTLAVELAPRHITVNAVAPGFFESRMTDYILSNFQADIEDDCPLARIGKPEEIVGVLIYLASRAGAYTNGAVIPVDGGTSISKGKREWM